MTLPDVADVLGSYFGGCRRQYLSVFPSDDVGATRCEAYAAVLFARVRACLKIGVLPDDAGFLIGMAIVWTYFGTFNFADITRDLVS